MVISFSEEEKKYLLPNKMNWKIKNDCPNGIKKRLKIKIGMIAEINNIKK